MGNDLKTMPNRDLLNILKRLKREKQHPEIYGEHGSSRFVPESVFWKGSIGKLKAELRRRQKQGLIRKSVGKTTRKDNLKDLIRRELKI